VPLISHREARPVLGRRPTVARCKLNVHDVRRINSATECIPAMKATIAQHARKARALRPNDEARKSQRRVSPQYNSPGGASGLSNASERPVTAGNIVQVTVVRVKPCMSYLRTNDGTRQATYVGSR